MSAKKAMQCRSPIASSVLDLPHLLLMDKWDFRVFVIFAIAVTHCGCTLIVVYRKYFY